MVTEIELLERPHLTPLDFCMCAWKLSKVSERKTDIRDEFLARILDGASSKKQRDEVKRTTRDFRTRVKMCIEVGGGIFERLL